MRFESVKMLKIEFGIVDFAHLYDLCKWNVVSSVLKEYFIFGVIFNHA